MNIFKNAYFGKEYKTRDGKKALLLAIHTNNISPYIEDALMELLIDNYPHPPIFTTCNSMGQCINDYYPNESIVSEWEEEINEKELDKLAYDYCPEEKTWATINGYKERDAFKAGYRKAKEK